MNLVGLVTLNSKYIHSSLAPWYLRAGILEYCPLPVSVSVLESTIHQDLDKLAQQILEKQFALVGFSCYIWNSLATQDLIARLKELAPTLPIVVGGPEVAYCPQEILESWQADYVLSGEGERPMALLTTQILQGERPYAVPGLSYRQGGGFVLPPPYTTQDLPPDPYCLGYYRQLKGRIAYIESSRGCPFSCAFCLSGEEQGVRFFPLDRTKAQLVALAHSGTHTVKFIDRTFNCNTDHCDAILRFLLKEYGKSIPTHLCFHFEMAGDILQESTLSLLAQMPPGYVQLEVGMQSFHPETLKAVGRSTHIPTLISNLERLVAMKNHHLHIDLIAGLPLEDLETFAKSFDQGYRLGAEMLQLGFLKIIPGSAMAKYPEKYPCSHQRTPPYQVESTPWLSRQDLALLESIEDGVDRLYNSGRFIHTLDYLFSASQLTPFALYQAMAQGISLIPGQSLEEYMAQVYQQGQNLPGVEGKILRDRLVLDWVETNSSCILPLCLRVYDPVLRQLTIALAEDSATAPPPGGKRFVGILYSQNQGFYVDYPRKNRKNKHDRGRYPVHLVDLPHIDP